MLSTYNLNSTFRYTCEKYDSSSSVSLSPERSESDNHTRARIIFITSIEHYFMTLRALSDIFEHACFSKCA